MADMVKDAVCGMEIEVDKAQAKSEHMGKTFYFCAAGCKGKFDDDPMKYMPKEGGGSCH